MFNKKTIIIIVLAIIIFFVSAILVFFLVKQAGNKATVNNVNSNITDELKNNNPGLSGAQLKFYAETAAGGEIEPCLGRDDASACVSSVAFISGDRDLCHNLDRRQETEKLYVDCVGAVLKKEAKVEIGRCAPLSGDEYVNCLRAIFSIFTEENDCLSLLDAEVRSVCRDLLNYKTAYLDYNRELCGTIKNDKLNQYCLRNIIDKNLDTDGDGLTDLEEINKYRTNYLFADTDGDGIKDGEAVRRGLIKAK